MGKHSTIITLQGEIDIANLSDAHEQVMGAVISSGHVIVDFTNCDFVDSATLGLLLNARVRANESDCQLVVVAPPDGPVASIIAMARLETLLTVVADIGTAQGLLDSEEGK